MRIGLFTDIYLGSGTNGVVFVVDDLARELRDRGHQVFIVAPKTGIATARLEEDVLWIPAVQGILFDEQMMSLFLPPPQLRTIASLDLDIIMFFTPGQIGLLGAHAAIMQDIPLVSQYSTDVIEYIERYPAAIVAVVAIAMATPFVLRIGPKEFSRAMRALVEHQGTYTYRQRFSIRLLRVLHSRCDAVVAVSDKMANQLREWGTEAPVYTIPTGVNRLPMPRAEARAFRRKLGINTRDKMVLYVGRLAKEKNLDLLVAAFDRVAAKDIRAHLVFVGDFAYRPALEAQASRSRYAERIHFTGRYPREKLGAAYAAADVFAFPSLTDTQALVLNEAAHAGLPFVWCDNDLNAMLEGGVTGLQAKNTASSIAQALLTLLGDEAKRQQYGAASKQLAGRYTLTQQTKKLEKLLLRLHSEHLRRPTI